MGQTHLEKLHPPKKTPLEMNINKTHSNKQPNTTPEDDQRNGRKRLV